MLDERFVGFHADFGFDVVALGFADERIEDSAGVVALPQECFQTVDQGILVSTVQRVAGLEGDDAIPTFAGEELADFAGSQNVFAKRGMLRLRQDANFAAEEMRFVGIALEHHIGAGVIGSLGEVDRLDVARLVPLEDIGDVERGDDVAGGVGEGDFLALAQLAGEFLGDRQRKWDRPGVELAIVLDDGFVEHAVKRGGIHGAGDRAEGAVAPAVDGGKVGVGNGDLRELGGFGLECGDFVGRDHEIDRFRQSAMGRDQISHRRLFLRD